MAHAGRRSLKEVMRCAVAVIVIAVGSRAHAQEISFHRLRYPALDYLPPGWSVVRDSGRWNTLYDRFPRVDFASREDRLGISTYPHRAPPVDFHQYMVLLVTLGGSSDCGYDGYVRRVVERTDSIVVEVTSLSPAAEAEERREGGRICPAMQFNDLDVVLVRRSAKPVAFHLPPGWSLRAASWWDVPSAARLNTLSDRQKLATALIRDPRTRTAHIKALVASPNREGWDIVVEILARPDVVHNTGILRLLASRTDGIGSGARLLLFEQHAAMVARDLSARTDTLRSVIEQLDKFSAPFNVDLASALLRHRKVRGDQFLLATFINHTRRFAASNVEACNLYLKRWPAWKLELPASWVPLVSCANAPPQPRRFPPRKGQEVG